MEEMFICIFLILPEGFYHIAFGFYLPEEKEDKMTTSVKSHQGITTRQLAKIAILSALAFVVMLIEFPLPIAPPFYKLDFSEVIVLMGGFALGPVYAVIIEANKYKKLDRMFCL